MRAAMIARGEDPPSPDPTSSESSDPDSDSSDEDAAERTARRRREREDRNLAAGPFRQMRPYQAGHFDVRKIVPYKFSGNWADGKSPSWREWRIQWSHADRKLTMDGADEFEKQQELLKVLSGDAKQTAEIFAIDQPGSYLHAIRSLEKRYDDNMALIEEIRKKFIDCPNSDGTADKVRSLRLALEAYRSEMARMRDHQSHYLFFYELKDIVRKFSVKNELQDWERFKQTRRNERHPLGYDISFDDFLTVLEDYEISKRNLEKISSAHPPRNKGDGQGKNGGGSAAFNVQSGRQKGGKTQDEFESAVADAVSKLASQHAAFATAAGQRMKEPPEQHPQGGFLVDGLHVKNKCSLCRLPDPAVGQKFKHLYARSCPHLKGGIGHQKDNGWLKNRVTSAGACHCCYAIGHELKNCTAPPGVLCGVDGCKQRHGPLFHPGGAPARPAQPKQSSFRPPPTSSAASRLAQSDGRGRGRDRNGRGSSRGGSSSSQRDTRDSYRSQYYYGDGSIPPATDADLHQQGHQQGQPDRR